MKHTKSIPIIDISAFTSIIQSNNEKKIKQSKSLLNALSEYGFCYITGSGVDWKIVDKALEQSGIFFKQEKAFKEKISIKSGEIKETFGNSFRGYQYLGENITQGHADRHEGIDFWREFGNDHKQKGSKLNGINKWPDKNQLPEFSDAFQDYFSAMETLGKQIMRALSLAFHQYSYHSNATFTALEIQKSETKFDYLFNDPFWACRSIFYPPMLKMKENNDTEKFDQKSVGCGEHTDYGCLTMIAQTPIEGCLQVRERETNEWITVNPVKEAFVINIGDALHCFSGGLLRATPHRVLTPKSDKERISLPFFFEPNLDITIKQVLENNTIERILNDDNGCKANRAEEKNSAQGLCYEDHLYSKLRNNFV